MSWCGAYDMAGNVKEWCANQTTYGKRYNMGGAWTTRFICSTMRCSFTVRAVP